MIEVSNFTKFKIADNSFKKIAEMIIKEYDGKIIDLSVSFVGRAEMGRLNKKYRKKNLPTDVLSFTYKNFLGHGLVGKSGEVVLCPEVIDENAKKYGENFKKELERVFIHGVLHVLGYDHEKEIKKAKEMEAKTNYYLNLAK